MILYTESIGPEGDILLLTASTRDHQSAFMKPILDNIANPKVGDKDLVDPEKFDCRISYPKSLYLRQSREVNAKISIPNKNKLYEIGIIAYPKKENYTVQLANDPLFLEKLFRNKCKSILQQAAKQYENKNKNKNNDNVQGYVPWDQEHSLTSPDGKWRPLDHVLHDTAVGHFLSIYFVDKHTGSTTDVYQMLEEYGIQDMYFSKHSETGEYSYDAVHEFGYPQS